MKYNQRLHIKDVVINDDIREEFETREYWNFYIKVVRRFPRLAPYADWTTRQAPSSKLDQTLVKLLRFCCLCKITFEENSQE